MSETKRQQQQQIVHNNTSDSNNSNNSNNNNNNNNIVLQLFDYNNTDNNLYISQTHLREPLLENSSEADNRHRRRMSMIHQEVYINTTRSLSSIVDTATRKIRHHIPDDFVIGIGTMQQSQQHQHQQERDDTDNDYSNEYQMNSNNTINNGRYVDCDEINMNMNTVMTTGTSISTNGGNTRKKSKKLSDEQRQTLSTTISNSSNHLHRILQIPSMKLFPVPTFHRSRPTSIDTSTSTSTSTTVDDSYDPSTTVRQYNNQQEHQQQQDFYDDVEDYTIPYNNNNQSETTTNTVITANIITPPPAPRNQTVPLSDVVTSNKTQFHLNEISHSVRRFFPSSS